MSRGAGRSLAAEDRRAILRELGAHKPNDFARLRLRALALLAMSASLRLSECLALDVQQIMNGRGVRTVADLEDIQAKGGHGGQFTIAKAARAALRDYVAEARSREWMGETGPLFVAMRRGQNSNGKARSHPRLSRVSAWRAWVAVQVRAGITKPYRFHDLRHESGTRFAAASGGDVFKVAAHMRLQDIRTAQRYVHGDANDLAELAEKAMLQ